MLKRTIGLSLLVILVVTGLAGITKNNSLTKSERKKALSLMKDTRSEVVNSIKELDRTQLNFKAGPDQWSIKECIYHIAYSEKKLWGMLEQAMKTPATPSRRAEVKFSDEELINHVEDLGVTGSNFDPFGSKFKNYRTVDEALTVFKDERAVHLKYIRTSTEDLRNHVVQFSFGTIDCYQLYLLIASHSERHSKQIAAIRSNKKFPK